jgi:hypothetical protein
MMQTSVQRNRFMGRTMVSSKQMVPVARKSTRIFARSSQAECQQAWPLRLAVNS